MRDYLNRFDPMPLQLGAVVRPKPEPTEEQKRIAAFREFDSKPWDVGTTSEPTKQPEADSEGWIKWEGGKCPLAEGVRYEVIRHNGSRLVSSVNEEDFFADGIWNGKSDPEWLMNAAKYRVIG